jgi:DNA-binding NtrC family response regulator
MAQGKKPTVLLIEADTSLRRLIALGLQNRDMTVIEVEELSEANVIETPDLLIIDIDSGVRSDLSLLTAAQTIPTLAATPTLVLAWERLPIINTSSVATTSTQLTSLIKPFDARKMHQSIDSLLMARATREAAQLAQAEAALLATYKTKTPPTIWPFITAIGLLIAFIGMLLQVAVIVFGLLIVLVALLLWTLGTKSAPLVRA